MIEVKEASKMKCECCKSSREVFHVSFLNTVSAPDTVRGRTVILCRNCLYELHLKSILDYDMELE